MTGAEAAEAMGEKELATGVHGHMHDLPAGIYIPIITADEPGSGAVGRFLDSLPGDRRIVFPNVMSGILQGMLLRRGFVEGYEYSEEFHEDVEIMYRNPAPHTAAPAL